ncbi:MAG: hypothetical protein U1F42_01335 [Candidatus Competibacteraceae bacterium]
MSAHVEHFGEAVYNTVIPRNVRLAEAPSYGLPIIHYDSGSRGAQSYRELAQELLERLRPAVGCGGRGSTGMIRKKAVWAVVWMCLLNAGAAAQNETASDPALRGRYSSCRWHKSCRGQIISRLDLT